MSLAARGATPRPSLRRIRYRAWQFFAGFRTVLSPAEVTLAREVLNEHELLLFAAMEPRDRRHSMNVLHWLRRHPGPVPDSRDLRAAALLHDAGKGTLLAVERIAFVVLEAISPSLVDRIGREDGPRWRRGLWRLRHHAELGARIVAKAGASARVASLIAGHLHDGTTGDPDLERLREADRSC